MTITASVKQKAYVGVLPSGITRHARHLDSATLLRASLRDQSTGNPVRNILVSPDAGISPDEAFDPSPYAFALTSRLIAEGDSWALPRKFKIAFSNSMKDSAFAQFNDLGFISDTRQGEFGFRVYVAGGMGAQPEVGHLLHEFIPVGDVCLVAEATKRIFSKYGNRKDKNAARLRFLWKQLGEAEFRKLYESELPQLREEGVPPLNFPGGTPVLRGLLFDLRRMTARSLDSGKGGM